MENQSPEDKTQTTQDKTQKFGPTANGEYLTPYQTTVVYRPGSVFETTIAFLSDRAQLIPLVDVADYSTIADICEHPSPEVLIFGENFSRDDLMKFFARGFQLIHVFSYVQNSKYLDSDNGHTTPFDNRVVPFGMDTLYEHLALVEGLTPLYLIEYVACATFTKYKSILDEKTVNYLSGRHLLRALEFAKKPLGVSLLQLCSSADGFDKINQLIIRGQSIHEVQEHTASERLGKGVFFGLEFYATKRENPQNYVYEDGKVTEAQVVEVEEKKYNVYAVCGIDLMNELINLAPVHPRVVNGNANFVMFYSMETHTIDKETFPGWRIVLMGVKDSPNAVEVLKKFAPELTTGTHGFASAWVATRDAKGLLPFIYP